MEVDYIIVGLGLAGLAFVEELREHNKSFIVFDDSSQFSSIVAGGTYNPVILKRFTPVWNGDQQLQLALPFYKKLEEKFNIKIDTAFNTLKIFNSIADENNWFMSLDKPMLSKYMNPTIKREKKDGVLGDFGYGLLQGTGWIDTKKLLSTYKNYLEEKQCILYDTFNYQNLVVKASNLKYEDLIAKKIVFCEGFGLLKNPFFNNLPLNGTKGETMVIHAPTLQIECQLKSSVFVFPLGNDLYKVGATFNWSDKTSIVTQEGREELVEKLKKVINVPYEIIEQSAGIRPTVKDRRPLVGIHKEHANLAVLNGLGTRGVMIAPTVAKNLYNHIEFKEPLDKAIDIKRFL